MAGAEQIQMQQFEVAALAAPPALLCLQLEQSSLDSGRELEQLASLQVMQNPALMLRVLDAQYKTRVGKPSQTLGQRLSALDLQYLHSLLSDSALHLILQGAKSNHHFHQLHWQQSRHCALLAQGLAEKLQYPDITTAASCGLLLHAGMLVLEQQHKASWVGLYQEIAMQSRLLDAEQQTLGTDHIEAGVNLLQKWHLEQNCIDAMRYQQVPLTEVLDASPLVKICWLANQLANNIDESSAINAAQDLFELSAHELTSLTDQVRTQLAAEFAQCFVSTSTPLSRPLADAALGAFNLEVREDLQKLQWQMLSETALAALESLDISSNDGLRSVLARALQQGEVDARFIIMTSDADKQSLQVVVSNRVASIPEALGLRLLPGRSALADLVLSNKLTTLASNSPRLTVIDRQVLDLLGGSSILCEAIETSAGFGVLLLKGSANYPQRNLLRSFVKRKLESYLQQTPLKQKSDTSIDLLMYQERVNEAVHEANNPLAIIKNYLQIMNIKQEEPGSNKEINIINTEIDRVAAILQNLRQTQSLQAASGKLDINALLRNMHKVFAQAFTAEKDISIELDLADDPAMVSASMDGLKQILTNLVKNAAEAFTQTGMIVLTTRRNVFQNNNFYTQLTVADNGPGITAEVMSNLFVIGNSNKGGNHTGSGLAIVKRLVDEMHGQISCQSDSKGASFTILLPQIA